MRSDDNDPYQRAVLQLLGVFAELEANMAQQRTREGIAARQANDEYHHGPAPLGFSKDDGRLVEGNNYDRVCTVLEMVGKGEMPKRQAAGKLDTSRRIIGRALERGELYGL
ncbi:recombinase family protein [Halobacterium sp. KA-6]|nr:recombinase family protein [Halobacterium sp. KA-6]